MDKVCEAINTAHEHPFRDLALIELMRKCDFVVTPDVLSVYGNNTNQSFIAENIDIGQWRESLCMKKDDGGAHLARLYHKAAESYIVDRWLAKLHELVRCNCGILITSKSVAAAINVVPSYEYIDASTAATAISNIASAIELDREVVYSDYEFRKAQAITVSESKVFNVIGLYHVLNRQYNINKCGPETLRQIKDTLCDFAKICTYLNAGDTLSTCLHISWDMRLTPSERVSGYRYKCILSKVALLGAYTPDAIISMILDNGYFYRSIRGNGNDVIGDGPEYAFLLEELAIIEREKRMREQRKHACTARVCEDEAEGV